MRKHEKNLRKLRRKLHLKGKHKPGDLLKGYKTKVDNNMRNYGDTDDGKKLIRVNKKLSKKDPTHKRPIHKNAAKYPEVLDTELHETLHAQDPKATEKQIYKRTRTKIRKLTRRQKQKLYGKFQ